MDRFHTVNIRTIVEYSLTGVAIILFGLFFYADFAIIFFALFLLIPCASIGIVFLTRKNIRCVIHQKDLTMQKGETETFLAEIFNDSIFPVTGMKILFRYSTNIRCRGEKVYRVSIGSKGKLSLSDQFTAWSYGIGTIGIEEMVLEDLFGFLNLKIDNKILGKHALCSVRILPSIPDVTGTELLGTTCTGGEEEERDTAGGPNTLSSQTIPGYEYREYVPGDSIRKINWKLSARKDELMIRMDEEAASASPLIWLEQYVDMEYWNEHRKLPIYHEERLVEGCLGCVRALLRSGTETTILLPGTGGYEELKLYTPEDIGKLQNALISMQFQKDPKVLGKSGEWDMYCRKHGSVLVFAVTLFDELQERLEQLGPGSASIAVVTEASGHDVPKTLKLTEEFSLKPFYI